jgi:HD-like signal output (HDOD) protein
MSGLLPLSDQVNQVLSRLSDDIDSNRLQLPSPPETLLALRSLLQQDASTDAIVALLSKEPHVSARLIKLANSVLFSSRFHVDSVKAAVTRLGLQKVSNLVTGFAITQRFLALKIKGIEKALNRVWLTSEHVAGISSTLAWHFSTIDADKALLAGQVHNIGQAPLLIHLNSLPELNQNAELRHKVTNLVLQRLSARVGSTILKKWSFPDDMTRLPYISESSATTSSRVGVSNLLQLAVLMKNCDFTTRLQTLPAAMLNAPSFTLLWQDEEDALTELNAIAEEVVLTQRLLRST